MSNIRSANYNGFDSASAGTGRAGWMLWSGSKALGNTSYSGVGLELVAGSESYLRFDSTQDGAELDIKARKFFIGTPSSQYISGSSGNIEISSSLFHLDPVNSKLIIGADATINASLSVNEIYTPAAATSISDAYAYIHKNGHAGFDGDGAGNYNVDFTNGTASIGGWAISSSYLGSNDIILGSSGKLQLGAAASLEFYSGSFTGSYAEANLAGKWEIDPDDGKSLQLRIPSGSFAGTEDRIAFYVSSSGDIGIGTKTPGDSFEVSGSGKSIWGQVRVTGPLDAQGGIASSGNISSSGYLYGDRIYGDSAGGPYLNTSGTNWQTNGGFKAQQSITCSADISASGEITGLAGYIEHTITPSPVGRGDIVRFGTGTSVTGKIYHYKSDGSWELANCTGVATSDGMLAVALGTDPDVDGMLLRGMCKLHTIDGTEAVGDVLYLSEDTTGNANCVAPAATGEVVRIIGYSLNASSKLAWFNPDSTYVEIA